MSSVTFKQAFELARQLSPEDQQLLAEQFEPDPDEAEIVARFTFCPIGSMKGILSAEGGRLSYHLRSYLCLGTGN